MNTHHLVIPNGVRDLQFGRTMQIPGSLMTIPQVHLALRTQDLAQLLIDPHRFLRGLLDQLHPAP